MGGLVTVVCHLESVGKAVSAMGVGCVKGSGEVTVCWSVVEGVKAATIDTGWVCGFETLAMVAGMEEETVKAVGLTCEVGGDRIVTVSDASDEV